MPARRCGFKGASVLESRALQFQFPVLVCDIGGTNVRVARLDAPEATLSSPVFLQTGAFSGLAEALASAGEIAQGARSVIACGAGPVGGRSLKLTNADWHIDGPDVARRNGLSQGLLLNDFEAQALSLPVLRPQDCVVIKPSAAPQAYRSGPQVILGPGTGLGTAALIKVDGRHAALASEACHTALAPDGDEEFALWPLLERPHGRITVEALISGGGLERLHRARARLFGLANPGAETAAEITSAALAGPESSEAASVQLFWRLIGRFAGDMALMFMATGGVTLAGGILPRLEPLLEREAFAAAFEAKAPIAELVRSMEVRLITAADTVLTGMAAVACNPENYVLDYPFRAWA